MSSPIEPDNFQQAWRTQSSQTRVTIDPDQLRTAVQQKQRLFRATIWFRDFREVGVAVLLLPYWFYQGLTKPLPWTWWLTIPAIIFVAGFILVDRRRHPQRPPEPGEPLLKTVQDSLNQVDHQIWLLRNVAWWYLLPFTISILAFFAHTTWLMPWSEEGPWGLLVGFLFFGFLSSFVFGLYYFIYWLNQWAVRSQLQPQRNELAKLLTSLTDESGEPLDEKQIASLRSTALALAAAGDVKPVEFKVSFWQLAFYGEIGFIGLWFFLMFGLTLAQWAGDFANQHWATKEAPETLPPIVTAEETNRYSLVARKVVDLINAGDCAAVQNLYNPGMSKAFPLKKTTEFYTRLAKQFGKIESVDGPTGKGYRGWTAFRLHCQRGDLVMSLALDNNNKDNDDKIAGIYFRPVRGTAGGGILAVIALGNSTTSANNESFVQRLFSWQHLGWLVLFFLGGLIYAWLLQKWTERAAGISTLGVHLQKGQILILWDEIKEIRVLKLLGIRSLCLIKESGEKTILRWTGLERHSDLRAAVERFAPANHPIRQHLSLLQPNPFRQIVAGLCAFGLLIVLGLVSILLFSNSEHPEKSPFAAVRWQESQPEVKIIDAAHKNGQWYRLLSLDDLPASEIVAFSQATNGDKWQKRFEEDLVALLTKMGHPPQDKVTLVVQPLGSSESKTLHNIPMTQANRRAIRNAAQSRESAAGR
jgi:hypothetical protein